MYRSADRNVMQEKRENLNGNTIKAVKQEIEKESQEEPAKPISEYKRQKEDKEEEPGSESEDEIPITQNLRSKGKRVNCSSLDELETPLAYKKRPSSMKRKFQCLDYDNEEVVLPNYKTQESRKRNLEKKKGNVQDNNDFTTKRAEEVQAKLDQRCPSFLRSMARSHVTRGFWLHIPANFCKPYMPKDDQIMVLEEDETGKEYEVQYFADRMGLSAGWRGFAIGQNLHEGDVVVFHLVRFDKFKVYIVRAMCSYEIDYSNLDAHPRDEHEINGEDSPLENMDVGHRNSFIEFHAFNITLNDANLDSLLTQDVRKNYYELCCARNSYLHHHLKSSNDMLAAGIISETTTIADYIKGCKLSTFNDDFTMWDKTLEGFEVLGMDVGFLRARMKYLEKIALRMRELPRLKEYIEASRQRDGIDKEIQNLKSRMHELEGVKRKLDSDIDALKVDTENFELIFESEANSPWSRDP